MASKCLRMRKIEEALILPLDYSQRKSESIRYFCWPIEQSGREYVIFHFVRKISRIYIDISLVKLQRFFTD